MSLYIVKDREYWETFVKDAKKYKNGYIIDLRRGFTQLLAQEFKNEYDIIQDIVIKESSIGTFFVVKGKYYNYGFEINHGGIDNSSVLSGWTGIQADGGISFAFRPK